MSKMSLLLLLALTACGGSSPDAPQGGEEGDAEEEEPDRRLLVEVSPVALGSVADHLETTGVIESEAQADISPEASGVIKQVLVEEGDAVRAGQVLAILANPSLDAGATRADIELERAQRELTKSEQLRAEGAISDRELEQARIALRTAQASASEAARTRGFTRITSPISGTVSIRDVRVGELATGRAFQVVDLDRMRVIVQLPEKDLTRIFAGQPVYLSSAYNAEAATTGVIQRISPVVDPSTGTVRVTVSLPAEQSVLRPGQFVKARIEIDRHDDVLTIPRRALVWEEGEPIAWVVVDAPEEEEEADTGEEEEVEEPGFFAKLFGGDDEEEEAEEEGGGVEIPQRVAERRLLTIGFSDSALVEVTEGLALGELVVVIGNANLREGAAVRLPEDPVPASTAEDEETDDGEKG